MTGNLDASDPEGDRLTIIVISDPDRGSVVIDADGTFVYTPSAELIVTGGTDEFVVEVTDQGRHLHGLLGLLQHDSGHSIGRTIGVTVPQGCGDVAVDVGESPTGVVVSPDGSRAYVTNSIGDTVSVIDTATYTVVATIGVDDAPIGAVFSPDGATVYVANLNDDSVSVIDTVTAGAQPNGVAVTPDGAILYVANIGADTVSVADTATNTVTDTIMVGDDPTWAVVSLDGATLYVTNSADASVAVVDTATNTVIDTITVGNFPDGIALTPDGAAAYLTHESDNTVSVIDLSVSQLNMAAVQKVPSTTPTPTSRMAGVVSAVWDLVVRAVRELRHTFFNTTPTLRYNPQEYTQTVVDGRAADAEEDPLRFNVTVAPQNGSVVINPDGTFVYTPVRELAAAGGTDEFVVKVADVGFHLHGPLGVFKPDFGRSATTTVAVAVDPACPGLCQANLVKVIDTIDVGDAPDGVAVSPDGTRLYVVNKS